MSLNVTFPLFWRKTEEVLSQIWSLGNPDSRESGSAPQPYSILYSVSVQAKTPPEINQCKVFQPLFKSVQGFFPCFWKCAGENPGFFGVCIRQIYPHVMKLAQIRGLVRQQKTRMEMQDTHFVCQTASRPTRHNALLSEDRSRPERYAVKSGLCLAIFRRSGNATQGGRQEP